MKYSTFNIKVHFFVAVALTVMVGNVVFTFIGKTGCERSVKLNHTWEIQLEEC